MRLPMAGMNNTQRLLYWYNNPDVMVNLQQSQMQFYRRQMGIAPEDPKYREIPAQRSPFRQ